MDFIIFLLLLGTIAVVLDALVFKKFIKTSGQDDTLQKELDKAKTEKDLLLEQHARMTVELEKKTEELGQVEQKLEREQAEKNEKEGRGKQMYAESVSLKEKNQSLQAQVEELNKKVVQFESHKEKKEKDFEQKVSHLEESRKALEDEKTRIRREDEERLEKQEAERNRVWAEHENTSIAQMKEVCVKPELGFSFYENTTLPETFDGKLKPDFLVEFLGQYIIFDAKMTRAQSRSLQDYINDQAKSTAKKIAESKNKDEIYSTIYFIVPQQEVHTLKKTAFYEGGYSFAVISIDAFEPILDAYKKITHYELAESFDPKERENIINLIAAFDQHIARQNAVNILTSLEGLKVKHMKESLHPEMKEEVEVQRKKMRVENFKPTDLKRLIANPEEQIEEMKKLVVPSRPPIDKGDVEDAQESLF